MQPEVCGQAPVLRAARMFLSHLVRSIPLIHYMNNATHCAVTSAVPAAAKGATMPQDIQLVSESLP